ncbi:hypothetical protein J6590_038048 [Homalodisca vitripennis]|nr:hypothetical protein J6590_038048 [Homalodisca vitripennis]
MEPSLTVVCFAQPITLTGIQPTQRCSVCSRLFVNVTHIANVNEPMAVTSITLRQRHQEREGIHAKSAPGLPTCSQ